MTISRKLEGSSSYEHCNERSVYSCGRNGIAQSTMGFNMGPIDHLWANHHGLEKYHEHRMDNF